MLKPVSIGRFIKAIQALPSDKPRVHPKKWYTTQKEHWLGWLRDYHGPGAYGRRSETRRDAEYIYNHIVAVEMLLWLIDAAGVEPSLASAARRSAAKAKALASKSAAVRKHVPWAEVEKVLWKRAAEGGSPANPKLPADA